MPRIRPRRKRSAVTAKALYDKLQRMETNVSRQLVRETAWRMGEIIQKTGGVLPELVPGYRVKILDGNHLRRTQRRIRELRELNAAPLPGHCAVILDPQLKLVIDVIPCEDAHAQERTLLPQVLETVERRDLWIADRNYCTAAFLFGIKDRRAYFAIRQHAQLPYELVGKRKLIGQSETGMVYEQRMRIFDAEGNSDDHPPRDRGVERTDARRGDGNPCPDESSAENPRPCAWRSCIRSDGPLKSPLTNWPRTWKARSRRWDIRVRPCSVSAWRWSATTC